MLTIGRNRRPKIVAMTWQGLALGHKGPVCRALHRKVGFGDFRIPVVVLGLAVACDVYDTGVTGPQPVPNRAPTMVSPIPAQSVPVGQAVEVDLSAYFNDPDGDTLTYVATTLDARVATASVATSVVTIDAVAQGTTSVTVTARDPGGLRNLSTILRHFTNQFSEPSFPSTPLPSAAASRPSTALTGMGRLIQTSAASSAALGGPATKRSGRAA